MMKIKKPPILPDLEFRSFGMEDLRAVEDGHYIEGHAAVYDQTVDIGGYFYEVIKRGAFDGCDFEDVLFCINHDTRKIPLARSRRNNGNSTMQIKLDERGLYIRAALDVDNNAEAKALYSAVSREDINGMSFIFVVRTQTWDNLDTEKPTRIITSIKKVREVTAASFPAYSGTDINARDQRALENAAAALENARSARIGQSGELEKLKLKIAIKAKGW